MSCSAGVVLIHKSRWFIKTGLVLGTHHTAAALMFLVSLGSPVIILKKELECNKKRITYIDSFMTTGLIN